MNLEEAIKHPIFKTISQVAKESNTKAYVIGGFVRDFLLKRHNPKDIDVVCEGSGIDLAKAVASQLGVKKVSVFKRFGTAMLKYKHLELEFVGARKESYSEDSRKPFVEDGTLVDDQNRRDFTINALAISLNDHNYGALIDPFNGVEELQGKTLKTPLKPSITYSDDPLRMMRAVRFATQLNFQIEKESYNAIKEHAYRLKIVSIERVMDEFQKIMHAPKPSIGLKLLDDLGLMKYILPELIALKGVEENEGKTHKDNFYHTLEVVDNIANHTQKIWLRWAALLHDVGKAPTKRYHPKNGWSFHSHEFVGAKMVHKIFRRLKLPLGEPAKYVKKMVLLSSRPISLVDNSATDSALRRLLFDAGEELEDLFILCKADITTKNPKKQKKYINNFEYVQTKLKEVEERDQIRNFQPPVTGEDIMQTFNIKPCKEIGVIKKSIKDAILEGKIKNDYQEAYQFMLEKGKELNL